MDAINALDSSAPQPKKKRENKPRTKPSAKTEIQPAQNDRTSNDMDTSLVGDVTQTPAKNVKAKKNRAEETASLNSPNAMNPNTDTVAIRPLSSIPSPSKETVEEENVTFVAHSEIKIDQKSKKKKKVKKMAEDEEGENFSNTFVDSTDNKEEKKSEVPDKETCNSHVKKKNAKGNVDDRKEPITNVEVKTESIVQQKKLKKKKKNEEEILEQKTEGEINSEKMAEEENIGQSKKAKKKKKKDKIDVDSAEDTSREKDVQTEAAETEDNVGENNPEPISNKKRKKKRKHHEGNIEAVLEKNKFEEQEDQDNVANPSECTVEGEQPAEVNHKNKKGSSVKNDSVAFSSLLPSHEALGPPSEKKKSE